MQADFIEILTKSSIFSLFSYSFWRDFMPFPVSIHCAETLEESLHSSYGCGFPVHPSSPHSTGFIGAPRQKPRKTDQIVPFRVIR
jgi:hypothetical protein